MYTLPLPRQLNRFESARALADRLSRWQLYGVAGDSVAPHLLVGQGYMHRAAEVIEADGFCTVAGARGCAYLVFTDTPSDVAWARSNLPRGLNVTFFSDLVPLVATWEEGAGAMGSPQRRVAALTDVVDLAAIAACDAHIVSPSTYSWWGAWLNSAPHKRVVVAFLPFLLLPRRDSRACRRP